MGYKSKAVHSNVYKAVVDKTEHKKRFSDIRDAKHAIEKDPLCKGKSIKIFYLPAYDVPLLVADYTQE
jgi:hypothetical protein